MEVTNQIAKPIQEGGSVSVSNFPASPSEYPLPGGQVADLKSVTVSNQIAQPTQVTDTQPVSAASLPLPAGAATSAKQLPDGHGVTILNAPPVHDEVTLAYTGTLLTTVTYKLAAATVETRTLSYTGTQLTSVVIS